MAIVTNTAYVQGLQNGQEITIPSNTVVWNLPDQVGEGTLTKSPPTGTDLEIGVPTTVTLTLTNTGTSDIIGYTFVDPLQPGLTFVDGTVMINGVPATADQFSFENNVLVIDPSVPLGAGQTMTVTFQVIMS